MGWAIIGSGLFGAKPVPELIMAHHQLKNCEQTYTKLKSKCNFSSRNAFENSTCQMSAVLPRVQYVNCHRKHNQISFVRQALSFNTFATKEMADILQMTF